MKTLWLVCPSVRVHNFHLSENNNTKKKKKSYKHRYIHRNLSETRDPCNNMSTVAAVFGAQDLALLQTAPVDAYGYGGARTDDLCVFVANKQQRILLGVGARSTTSNDAPAVEVSSNAVSIRTTTLCDGILQVPMITITNFVTSSAAAAAVPSQTPSSASAPRYILNTDDISDSAVTAEKLAPLSVSTNRIQSNAIVQHHLVDMCVSSGKLASNAVTASKIASLAVQAIHLDGASVQTRALDTSCVTTDKLGDGAVTSSKLAVSSVTSEKLTPACVLTASIAPAAVTADLLASACVLEQNLSPSCLATASIQNAAVTTSKLADAAVTMSKLAVNAVTAPAIAAATVNATHLSDACVPVRALQAACVVTSKLSDGAVTAAKIAEAAIQAFAIGTAQVPSRCLVDQAITADKLGANAVTTGKLTDLCITTEKLAESCVTSNKVGIACITASKLAVGAVTTEKISDAAVIGDKLAESSVGTAKLADGAVTQDKLAESSVGTVKLAASAITAEKLAAGSVRSVHLDSNLSLQGSVFLASNAFVGLSECNYTTHALHVRGSVYAAGGYYSLSDPACKAHISNVDGADALRRLHQVQGVTYELLEDAAPCQTPTQPCPAEQPRHVGFLAPAVLRAFPEAVHCKRRAVRGANSNDLPETGSHHHMSIAYGNLVAVLAEAVKHMDQRLTAVESHLSRSRSTELLCPPVQGGSI